MLPKESLDHIDVFGMYVGANIDKSQTVLTKRKMSLKAYFHEALLLFIENYVDGEYTESFGETALLICHRATTQQKYASYIMVIFHEISEHGSRNVTRQ